MSAFKTLLNTSFVKVHVLLLASLAMLFAYGCGAESPNESNEDPTSDSSVQLKEASDAVQASTNPGVFDDRVVFGQSAAFSGPAQALGHAMRLGIEAAFHQQNQEGGVHGRQLELVSRDDRYEPNFAYVNTLELIRQEQVFALIGEVGTPTSRSAARLVDTEAVPFLAPFTGAGFLRSQDLDTVVNLRASYAQETEFMVKHLTEDLGVTRVAVMYQNDSYGQSGLSGVREALEKRGLKTVATWYYERNTSAVKAAVYHIASSDPEAVIMIGSYRPVAKAISLLRVDIDPIFLSVSFVGSNALASELGTEAAGVFITQVVPEPENLDVPAVAEYSAAIQAFNSDAKPDYVSLEGYLAGRLAIVGLKACTELTRQCFLDTYRSSQPIDLQGLSLQFGVSDNQGSDAVSLTVINEAGKVVPVASLNGSL